MDSALETSIDRSFFELLDEVAKENPVSVLYLEDNRRAARHVRDLFEDEPVLFYSAANAEEADELLARHNIDVAVVDVKLGDGTTTGEEWIFRNSDQLSEIEVIVLTGNFGFLKNASALRSIVKTVIIKGDPEQRELWEKPGEMARQRAMKKVWDVTRVHATMIGLFRKWVESFEGEDETTIVIGDRELGMMELLEEVERGTTLGNRYLRLFVEDLECLL